MKKVIKIYLTEEDLKKLKAAGITDFTDLEEVYRKDAASGAAPGWVCISRVDTQFRVAGVATDTILEVDSTTGMVAGDIVGIVVDDGSIDWTDIDTVDDSDTMTVSDGLSDACAINNNIYTYRWIAMANLA